MAFRSAICAAVMLVFAGAVAAPAQESGVTWLAFSKVKSGKTQDAVEFTLQDKGFYDGLMADGTIQGWGIATPINHRPGDLANHAVWVATKSWAHIDKWVGAFQQYLATKSAEQRDADEKRFAEIYVDGSHYDVVADDMAWTGSGDRPPRYVYVGSFYAHPGQEGELTELYKSLVVPVGKKLMSEGHLAAFGLHTPSVHTGDGWTHTSYYMFTGLEGVDRYHQEITKLLTPEVAAEALATHDVARHSDQIWLILHNGGSAAE